MNTPRLNHESAPEHIYDIHIDLIYDPLFIHTCHAFKVVCIKKN